VILSASTLILRSWGQWTEAAGPFSLYGAASLKNMLQKIRRVRYYSEKEDRLPDGDINFLPPASLKTQRTLRI